MIPFIKPANHVPGVQVGHDPHYADIPICFIPQVSPFHIIEKVKLGVLKMKVYFLVLTRMVKEGVVT